MKINFKPVWQKFFLIFQSELHRTFEASAKLRSRNLDSLDNRNMGCPSGGSVIKLFLPAGQNQCFHPLPKVGKHVVAVIY